VGVMRSVQLFLKTHVIKTCLGLCIDSVGADIKERCRCA
jgi:hypothetical protein